MTNFSSKKILNFWEFLSKNIPRRALFFNMSDKFMKDFPYYRSARRTLLRGLATQRAGRKAAVRELYNSQLNTITPDKYLKVARATAKGPFVKRV